MNVVGGGGQKWKGIGVDIAVRWHVNKRGKSNRYIANGNGTKAGRGLCALACL